MNENGNTINRSCKNVNINMVTDNLEYQSPTIILFLETTRYIICKLSRIKLLVLYVARKESEVESFYSLESVPYSVKLEIPYRNIRANNKKELLL